MKISSQNGQAENLPPGPVPRIPSTSGQSQLLFDTQASQVHAYTYIHIYIYIHINLYANLCIEPHMLYLNAYMRGYK